MHFRAKMYVQKARTAVNEAASIVSTQLFEHSLDQEFCQKSIGSNLQEYKFINFKLTYWINDLYYYEL